MNVAVLGASADPEKYATQAIRLLREKGHKVFPVHPALKDVEGVKVYPSLDRIPEKVDTISLYVSEKVSSGLAGDIIAKAPRRVIFNPGAENAALEEGIRSRGIQALRACTLVLLKTGQF